MMPLAADAQELTPIEVISRYRPHDGTVSDFVASRREPAPDRPMMQDDQRSWTWAEMESEAARLAAGLIERGVGAGDRVAIMARNSGWHPLALLAVARIGATLVPINPDYKALETGRILNHCTPRLVLHDNHAAPVIDELAPASWVPCGLGPDLLHEPVHPLPAMVDAQATVVIVYTSGTTGQPKGVMHSQASLVAAGEAFVQRQHLQPDEHMLAILPMFHVNALFYSISGAWAAGARLFVAPRFSASGFWQTVDRYRITQVNIIEAIANILLKRPADEFIAGHSLRKVYGARDAMMKPLRQKFGIPHLVGGYAMTEIPGVLNTPYDGPNTPGSMGKVSAHPDPARPWASCRIVDPDGQPVPDGQPGELQVRTPIVMQGYFNDPAQSKASFDDGWFRTGDLVRRDSAGFYFFLSRLKDIIRRRGENIAGTELDEVVNEHPDVLYAAAIGVDSPFGDQDILIAAVPRAGAVLAPEDIAAWCSQHLAAIKRPKYVLITDSLPMTPTHKVAKAKLRDQAGDLMAAATDLG